MLLNNVKTLSHIVLTPQLAFVRSQLVQVFFMLHIFVSN